MKRQQEAEAIKAVSNVKVERKKKPKKPDASLDDLLNAGLAKGGKTAKAK
eukprot:CAMPEP_0184862644 /NCGR_PEP_ID=MMETSP0580-20130426/7079_1 /TAXON_ID=1118495 /ORGANISM="Dactyliosolen fragilissimus" /LENGTH=49 /DNA_ID=CAMNT_0027360597 /DNA_START=173 /DNA_END=322 /DNA_ORIENTATION=-